MIAKIINYLESLGFENISHNSSHRQIFHYDNITISLEERVNKNER